MVLVKVWNPRYYQNTFIPLLLMREISIDKSKNFVMHFNQNIVQTFLFLQNIAKIFLSNLEVQ